MQKKLSRSWQKFLKRAKLPVTLLSSLITTVILFYLMQSLISDGKDAMTEDNNLRLVDFVRISEEIELKVKKRRPKVPPEPDEPPEPLKQKDTKVEIDDAWSAKFEVRPLSLALEHGGNYSSDGEYLPILKVQPVYPLRALQRGLFGWVVVEFTVDDIGRVIDPIVVDNCVANYSTKVLQCHDKPGSIFDRPAISAAQKFKYKPRIVNGTAIATTGVRHLISFELKDMPQSYKNPS